MQVLVTTAQLLVTAYYVATIMCLNFLMSSLQPIWKDAQQTPQTVSANCSKFLQLWCF